MATREKNRLNPLAVKRATKPGYLADGDGLYLLVAKGGSGGKSWVLRYTIDGRTREMGLGSAGENRKDRLSLAEARKKAIDARARLRDGEDPIDARQTAQRARKQAKAQQRTFAEAAAECIAAKRVEWTNVKHSQQWENTLATYAYPHFGKWPVEQVDKTAILHAVRPIWTVKIETATRLLGRIRAVLRFAASAGYRPAVDPSVWDDIAEVLPKASKLRRESREHHAAAPYREIHGIVRSVRASTASPATRSIFEFIILTAARSGEARGARWGELDIRNRCWLVPAERMKARKPHRVPLSDRAVEILGDMREARGTKNPAADELVFPAPRGGMLSDMVLTQLMRRTELPYTMHGFRSSFRDWAAEQTAFAREVAEHALAHQVEDEAEAAYFRSDLFARRRELMNAWAEFLETAPAAEDDDENVIPLRAAK
ncbi:tyrosine-type recombinase/integrase [Paraburkholderia silvatlantica]|uniref:Integrase n=1 Tax=Paraburkholderia silvatlantica TaxID=321895 RepID=A0ABR6FRU3_9BURK|nr:site-specific integrase [Paraburkholderia silvatlantica]MBB2930138.1 integrase [Paraburkholderia silvatlantica]